MCEEKSGILVLILHGLKSDCWVSLIIFRVCSMIHLMFISLWCNNMKIVLIIGGVLSVLLNLVLIYGGIDTAVTLDHQNRALGWREEQLKICNVLLTQAYPKIGYQGFLEIFEDVKLDVLKKRDINLHNNEEISIGDVSFEFSKDKKLVSIDMDMP